MKIMRDYSGKLFGSQLLLLVAIWVFSFVLFYVFSFTVISLFTPLNIQSFFSPDNYKNEQYKPLLILVQASYSIFIFGLPAVVFAYLNYPSVKKYLGWQKPQQFNFYLLAIIAMLFALPAVAFVTKINEALPLGAAIKQAEQQAAELTQAFLNFKSFGGLLIGLLYIAIIPAIVEELFFRSCLQRILTQHLGEKKIGLVIIITATVFALLHGQLLSALPRIYLGVLLGYIYYYTSSIWVCIIAHAFNNGLQVILQYLNNIEAIKINVIDTPDFPIWLVIISLLSTVGFVYYFKQNKISFEVLNQETSNQFF